MKFDLNEFVACIRENEVVSNERLYDQEIENTFEIITSITESITKIEEDIRELKEMLEEEQIKYESLVIYREDFLNNTKGDNNEIKN